MAAIPPTCLDCSRTCSMCPEPHAAVPKMVGYGTGQCRVLDGSVSQRTAVPKVCSDSRLFGNNMSGTFGSLVV